ncbi:MAG: ATP-binding protein, partial [Candidatus Orphnella occulta]|nr:ATP-binding protein [Candidatus Orphnella occulta]
EIRNPLTAIKTFSEFLPQKYNDKTFRDDFSQIVKAETQRIDSLVSQLLEFAKPSALNIKPCDIHGALDYTLSLLSGDILKSEIEIVKNYDKARDTVAADPEKLKHIFFNLIRNSIEAIDKNGRIIISTRLSEDYFNIEIRDNGHGIKKKDLNKVFEPFFSSKESGTGLGLCVVQSIVAEHGGNISAKSAPGEGTTFTVSLPR